MTTIAGLVVAIASLVGIIGVLLAGTHRLLVRSDRLDDRRDQQVLEAGRQGRVDLATLSAHHAADVERLHGTYARLIDRQADTFGAAIEKAMNLVNYGQPTRNEAVVEEREPDAMTRAARLVTEDTVALASNRLREEYAKLGPSFVPTDKELESEARLLVTGGQWRAPDSLRSMLKD